GCRLEEVTTALGIRIKELFFDNAITSNEFYKIQNQRALQRDRMEENTLARGLLADARREAEALLALARNPGLTGWKDEELQEALNVIADAYDVLFTEKVECGIHSF